METRQVRARWYYGRTDGHDEANRLFFFCDCAYAPKQLHINVTRQFFAIIAIKGRGDDKAV